MTLKNDGVFVASDECQPRRACAHARDLRDTRHSDPIDTHSLSDDSLSEGLLIAPSVTQIVRMRARTPGLTLITRNKYTVIL